jgi:phosphinothricin acetyltransferase
VSDPPGDLAIRSADPVGHAEACAAIYAPYVTDSPTSFEEEPPTPAQMGALIAGAHEWLVAERGGRVVGYAYGSRHHERAAYRWAANVSVYLDPAHHRAGIGRRLYEELFSRLQARGFWQLCAGITLPNDASVGLHRTMGFETVGTYRRIGFKHGAWRDVVWLQRDLRPGEDGPPAEIRPR